MGRACAYACGKADAPLLRRRITARGRAGNSSARRRVSDNGKGECSLRDLQAVFAGEGYTFRYVFGCTIRIHALASSYGALTAPKIRSVS